jgi:hypothetical protein
VYKGVKNVFSGVKCTTGDSGDIITTGDSACIITTGDSAGIITMGDSAGIITTGDSADIITTRGSSDTVTGGDVIYNNLLTNISVTCIDQTNFSFAYSSVAAYKM